MGERKRGGLKPLTIYAKMIGSENRNYTPCDIKEDKFGRFFIKQLPRGSRKPEFIGPINRNQMTMKGDCLHITSKMNGKERKDVLEVKKNTIGWKFVQRVT